MSHVADVQMHVKDLAALRAAVEAKGGVWHEGQTTHKWYGRFLNDWGSSRAAVNRRDPKTFGKCLHAISVPGVDYEIGVVQSSTGEGYDLVYDNYASGKQLEQHFGGEGFPEIKREYSRTVASRELSRKGYRLVESTNANGDIVLKAVKS